MHVSWSLHSLVAAPRTVSWRTVPPTSDRVARDVPYAVPSAGVDACLCVYQWSVMTSSKWKMVNWLWMWIYLFKFYNLGKKVLEHFVLTMVNCQPYPPVYMLRTTNTFNSLPKCPNIDWWGKGKEEMKVVETFLTLTSYELVGDPEHNLHIIFSEGYLVFQ